MMLRLAKLRDASKDRLEGVTCYTGRPALLRQLEHGWDLTGIWWRLPLLSLLGRFPTDHIIDELIGHMVLPTSLLELILGGDIDQSITTVIWPKLLTKLAFGCYFNQPIRGIVWPSSLLELLFGGHRNWPTTWPGMTESCLDLTAWGRFNQPITGLI